MRCEELLVDLERTASHRSFPGRIEFTSTTEDCGLVGSHHVKDFKLDERFNLDVRIIFQWKDEDGNTSGTGSFESDGSSDSSNTINAEGSITIEVGSGSLRVAACARPLAHAYLPE